MPFIHRNTFIKTFIHKKHSFKEDALLAFFFIRNYHPTPPQFKIIKTLKTTQTRKSPKIITKLFLSPGCHLFVTFSNRLLAITITTSSACYQPTTTTSGPVRLLFCHHHFCTIDTLFFIPSASGVFIIVIVIHASGVLNTNSLS